MIFFTPLGDGLNEEYQFLVYQYSGHLVFFMDKMMLLVTFL